MRATSAPLLGDALICSHGVSLTSLPLLCKPIRLNVEAEYNIKAFDDLDRALAEKPDAAFICNPTSYHLSAAQACAERNCHLFIEKPVSHNLVGLHKLLDTVKTRNLVTLVGYQFRFHPCLKAVSAMLAAHAIGRILTVRATVGEYLPGWHVYEDYRQNICR